jgi:hypothetical protein
MPTANELREMLKKAEEDEQAEDRNKREAQTKAWKVITSNPDNWEWSITPETYSSYFQDSNKLVGLRISKRVNPEVVKEWEKGGFPTFSNDYHKPSIWHGMFYHRTDENILTNEGGGHCILKVPKLCSDKEWKEIEKGNIPDKFK